MKKIVLLLMSLVLLLSLFSCSWRGKDVGELDGVNYVISDDGSHAIVVGGEPSVTHATIKSEYEGLPVTEIAGGAYDALWGYAVTSIDIPASVTKINDNAFLGCLKVTSFNVDAENEHYKSVDGDIYTKDGKTLVKYAVGKEATEFTVPDSVTAIAPGAFWKGDFYRSDDETERDELEEWFRVKLEKVNFGANSRLTTIGDNAFATCTNLKSIEIPATVTSIGNSAFASCIGLTSVTFRENGCLEVIGNSAFRYCKSLTSIRIPDTVTAIGDHAFYAGDKPRSTEGEESSANSVSFAGMQGSSVTAAAAITISNNFVIDGDNVQFGDHIIVPHHYIHLDHPLHNYVVVTVNNIITVFANGESALESVIFGENSRLTSIGEFAFYGCESLKSIKVPAGVSSIGESAFSSCFALNNIEVASANTHYKVIDGNLYSNDGKLLMQYAIGKSAESFVVPDGVVEIGGYAFANSKLTAVTLPEGVKTIGMTSFYDCSKLENISIPDSIENVEKKMFRDCEALVYNELGGAEWLGNADNPCVVLVKMKNEDIQTYEIGENTKFIFDEAFSGCMKLTTVTIPASVTSIGDRAFRECRSLTSVTIPASVTSIGDRAFCECRSLTSVTIPEGVTSIGDGAFERCSSLTSVTIPASVTSIGNYAFERCEALVSIDVADDNEIYKDINGNLYTGDGKTLIQYAVGKAEDSFNIPDGVESIARYAFARCSSLESISIPASVTSIGDCAFERCSSLTSVTIPASVTSIGDRAFSGCSSLTSVEIPASVTSIGNYAFEYCSSLESISIPASVTSIGNSAFEFCSSLESISIPASVTSIGNYAFYGCVALTEINISANVEYIGTGAFAYCHSLERINVAGDNENYKAVDGNLYTKDGKCLKQYIISKDEEVFKIPDGVEVIDCFAFTGCKSLVGVVAPESVSKCYECAFEYCSSFSAVYYHGTAEEWEALGFDELTEKNGINVYTYRWMIPLKKGNFWHYDSDGNVEIWK